MSATVDLFLDKYHPKQDGKCNVKVRVYFNRRHKYYATKVDLKPEDFSRLMVTENRSTEQRAIFDAINEKRADAVRIISGLKPFTFSGFEELFLEDREIYSSVTKAFNEKIKELIGEDRVGTAGTYECARNSLNAFRKNLEFSDITPKLLRRYENWMLENGNSKTTVGIYLRNLRVLFNARDINPKMYPFGKGKYEIPTGRNIKKALTMDEISRIYNYDAEPDTWEERAKNYWVFLYLANGMNVKDFCFLRWGDVKEETIRYVREKTKNTGKEAKTIVVDLKPEMRAIMQKYGRLTINKDAFIFPHLMQGMDAIRQSEVIANVVSNINKYMKRIGKAVGIEQDVTTYVARHSFATVLKRSGASVELISDLMGHSDISTTQKYLAGFEDEQIKKATDVLLGFTKTAT